MKHEVSIGLGTVLAAYSFIHQEDAEAEENENSLLSQAEVPMLEDYEISSEDKKSDKAFATRSESAFLELREQLEELIPVEFDFWLMTDREGTITLSWQLREGSTGIRVSRLSDENLISLLMKIRAVDWESESELAEESDAQLKEFCKSLRSSLPGGGLFS